MTKRILSVSIALLAGATMLGCQDLPTDATQQGPDPRFHHKPGHAGGPGGGGDDGGGSSAGSAELVLGGDSNGDGLGDAMITSAAQALEVDEDADLLRLKTGDGFTFSGEHNFDDTRAAAEDQFGDGSFEGDACTVKKKGNRTIDPAKIESAIAKLTDPGQERDNFLLRVDKNALGGSSEDHKIFANWTESDGSTWDLNVRPSKVTLLSGDINGDATVQYTGGSVSVKNRSENPSFTVVCPVHPDDAVEAAIVRL